MSATWAPHVATPGAHVAFARPMTDTAASMLELHSELQPRIFKQLVADGGISSASIKGSARGLFVLVRVGSTDRALGAARGGTKYFQTLDGAGSVLWQAGIREFAVDMTNWIPKRLTE